MAHSAVLSEDLLGSNPTGIALHCVPTHACACSETFASGPRPKAQVRLAAAMCLHIAVALDSFGTCGWTDVGGTSTRTKIVGPTALAARPTLYVSGARPQRPVGCPSTLVREVELLRPKPTRIPVAGFALAIPTERKARGLDPVARDKPSDNLMLKRCASLVAGCPSLPGARAQAEKGGRILHGSGRRRFDQ